MRVPENEFAELAEDRGGWPSRERAPFCPRVPQFVRHRVSAFILFAVVLAICFSHSIYGLVHFAVHSDLYSHIIVIPFISAYLIWLKRRQLALNARPARKLAVILFASGTGILAGHYLATASGWQLAEKGYLALMTLALLVFLWGACLFFFGVATVRAVILPLALLFFAVPFPDTVLHQLQTFLQVASAAAAHVLFQISDTPVLRQGTSFQLPGFSLEVALECSGIHSSLVLLITSLVAAHLVLRKLWTKALLVLFGIPLAIIRNGIRVFTIAQLCIHIGPEMFHSYIHKHGGPIFFVGSLVPLFLLVLLLMKLETKGRINPGS